MDLRDPDARPHVRRLDEARIAEFAPDPLLHFVPYRSHPVVIFVPRGHPFDGHASVALAEIADEPLVMREKGSTTRKALEDALRRLGLAPKISLEVGSREAVREAVIRGLGIAAVSEFEFVPDPRLAVLAIAGADVRTSTHVVTLRERRHARMVAGFLAIVDELLGSAAEPRTM
jgi:DNA-binding transcriptional LysR family regulator